MAENVETPGVLWLVLLCTYQTAASLNPNSFSEVALLRALIPKKVEGPYTERLNRVVEINADFRNKAFH